MAAAFVQKVKGTVAGASVSISFAAPPAAGNLVVVQCSAWAGRCTVTDNHGNTYVELEAAQFDTNNRWANVLAAENVATGSPFTITVSNPGVDATIAIASEVSGVPTASTADVSVTGTGSDAAPTVSSGALAQADEIIFAMTSLGGANDRAVTSPGAPWVFIDSEENFAALGDVDCVYRVVSSASAVAPVWSLSGTAPWVALLVSFKAAAVPAVAAPLGMFDPDLREESWFDPQLIATAWMEYGPFDNAFVDVAAAGGATSDVPMPTMIPMALLAM